MSSSNSDLVAELFEDTVDCFIEECRESLLEKSSKSFELFVLDNLPCDVLDSLKQMLGVDEDDEMEMPEQSFLADIYDERFGIKKEDEEDSSFGSNLLCEICERYTKLTRHHLYPRKLHAKLESRVSQQDLGKTISVCRLCHATIHRLFTHEELAQQYHTLNSLMETESMQKFARWAQKQASGRQR